MNTKRFAALAAFAALLSTAGPAMAANPTGTVTVKWNTQTVATMTLWNQYTGSQTRETTAESIWENLNGGAGVCQASDTEAANGTVNFGNVTPDGTDYTDCLEDNATNAYIVTNDTSGYTVTESESGAPATYDTAANGSLVCILPNGTWANNLAYTASTRTSNALTPSIVSTTACPGGDFIIASGNTTLLTSAAATTGTNLGADYELVLGPNAASGQATLTVTYTMTPS